MPGAGTIHANASRSPLYWICTYAVTVWSSLTVKRMCSAVWSTGDAEQKNPPQAFARSGAATRARPAAATANRWRTGDRRVERVMGVSPWWRYRKARAGPRGRGYPDETRDSTARAGSLAQSGTARRRAGSVLQSFPARKEAFERSFVDDFGSVF